MEMRWCSERGLPHSELLEWSSEDRSKLTAFLIEDSQRCGMCGTAPWEWEEDRYAYEPVPMICWGCYHKEGAAADETRKMPGTRITLVPRVKAARMKR